MTNLQENRLKSLSKEAIVGEASCFGQLANELQDTGPPVDPKSVNKTKKENICIMHILFALSTMLVVTYLLSKSSAISKMAA